MDPVAFGAALLIAVLTVSGFDLLAAFLMRTERETGTTPHD